MTLVSGFTMHVFMNSSRFRFSFLLAVLLTVTVPFSLTDAQAASGLTDPNLEKTPLPDYQYSPDGDSPDAFLSFSNDQGFSNASPGQSADAVARRKKVDDILRKNRICPSI